MSTTKRKNDLVIIGGGAAGMLAAAVAAVQGAHVLLLEKNERNGKKLAITGKGRCNVTNACPPEEVLKNVPRNSRFLYSAVYGFPPERAMAFFEDAGCPLKVERGNRVFPTSDRSADVIAALERLLRRYGVARERATVTAIETENGAVCGVKAGERYFPAENVLLCTGGLSYPLTGSTGDGYRIAQALGHTVTPLSGSLVPLVCEGDDCAELQGLSLRNTGLQLRDGRGKLLYQDFGELLFTHFGVSGPMALSASAHRKDDAACELLLDLKPALDEEKLDARFLRDFAQYANRSMENALADLYPHSMISVLLRRAGIDTTLRANSLTKAQRRALLEQTKRFSLHVTAARSVDEAIITRGGISVREIDPKTMESKLVRGLHFAGEIIDCDAYTGGFNLQIAWSTAYAAAMHCAES